MTGTTTRREVLRAGLAGAAALGLGGGLLRPGVARAATGSYGPLGAPDAFGVRLPIGFSAKVIAITGQPVGGQGYLWHRQPDGAQTLRTSDGGWLLVQNGEDNGGNGGVSVLRFSAAGAITAAYSILTGTKWNCHGGITPWQTWLSCEEFRNGQVWECDPFGTKPAVVRPALGTFVHEAAPVHPRTGWVYMTEDSYDGRLYRFRPAAPGDLREGTLEAARVDAEGKVTWKTVSQSRPARDRDTTIFARGEGAWISGDTLYFATTGDDRVWALDLTTSVLRVIYDGLALAAPDLRNPDNLTVHEQTGHLYVAEDGDDIQLVQLVPQRTGTIWSAAPFLQFVGHPRGEVSGPAFSPDGMRLYVNSQRGLDGKTGLTFEVTGPFDRR